MTFQELELLLDQHQVTQVKIGGFDVDGVLRGKYISREKFASAAAGGLGFCDVIFGWDCGDALYDNAQATGWHTGYPDALAKIDLATLRFIPWEPGTAFFLLDFFKSESVPLAVSPRQVLRNVVATAGQMGFRPMLAVEFEFFFFQENPHSLREKDYRGLKPLTPGMFGYSVLRSGTNAELVQELLRDLQAMEIPVEGFHTETGPGVYEAAIRYADAMAGADRAALFKTAVKQIAARHGLTATFMAKWNPALPGCSGHLHQSLWDAHGRVNLFYDPDASQQISATMRQFMAGQLALMPELTALACPTVNSYKRLAPNTWAPVNATWGVDNRTTALRAVTGPGSGSARVEYRLAGADINPYLATAASLASGLYGIRQQLELPPAVHANAYQEGSRPLPRTLGEAAALLKNSALAPQLLDEEFIEHFISTREWEVRQFARAVTDWELERYFEII
jgi:glutamine synthetase